MDYRGWKINHYNQTHPDTCIHTLSITHNNNNVISNTVSLLSWQHDRLFTDKKLHPLQSMQFYYQENMIDIHGLICKFECNLKLINESRLYFISRSSSCTQSLIIPSQSVHPTKATPELLVVKYQCHCGKGSQPNYVLYTGLISITSDSESVFERISMQDIKRIQFDNLPLLVSCWSVVDSWIGVLSSAIVSFMQLYGGGMCT